MYTRLLLIWLTFSTGLPAAAQVFHEKDFTRFTTREGLSENYVSGLEQDSSGFLWIATYHGLNRFDGKLFRTFLREPDGIPDNTIFSMQLLGRHQLAIATDDGAQVIDTRNLARSDLRIPSEEALRYWSNACRFVYSDQEGNYGVSTKTGFYVFTPEGKLKKRWDHYKETDIGRSWMMFGNRIQRLPDGNMMQQNLTGFTIYDYKKQDFTTAESSLPALKPYWSYLQKTKDISLFVSQSQLLIINTETNSFDIVNMQQGNKTSFASPFPLIREIGWQTRPRFIGNNTYVINSKNKGFFLLRVDTLASTVSISPEKFFPEHYCTSVLLDRDGRLWVGTTRGLFMANKRPHHVISHPVEISARKETPTISCLLVEKNEVIAGTEDEEILVIDKQSGRVRHQIPISGILPGYSLPLQFIKAYPDTLWISTPSGLIWLDRSFQRTGPVKHINNRIKKLLSPVLYKDSRRNIWIGTNHINQVYYFNTRSHEFDSVEATSHPLFNINIVSSIAEDQSGNIWFGGDAIARWNPLSRKIDTLITYLPQQKNRKKGFTVMRDPSGNIWTTINDDGFARITGGKEPVHIRPENLLPDFAAQVYPTMLGDRIFICASKGIGYLNTRDLKTLIFTIADGLPENPASSNHFVLDSSDNSTWFATRNRLCSIPLRAANYYTSAPVLLISELAILNNKTINYPRNKISLKHYQNDIRLSLSAINFTDPENMRFAYRFKEKQDTNWIDIGTQQSILLTNISPGDYQMQVKCYSWDNKWPEQNRELMITVTPPFHKTAWFFTIIFFVLAMVAGYLYRLRIRQINKQANLDKQLVQTEMKALHSQMNPHFVFNCLNSIKQMILENDNQKASRYLSKFAQLIRITLNQSSKSFISLHQTIDYLYRYLEMEQIRTSHFTYSIDIDQSLQPEEIFIPPMLIQPFIENAIWHGLSPGQALLQIDIRFFRKDDDLVCIIDDNGVGIDSSLKHKEPKHTHHSLGIANVRQRILLLNEKYNMKCSLTIEDRSQLSPTGPTGTIVTLHLPIKTTNL